ncbi:MULTISPECIES: indole-3-glycerol phosphate synthase [unclassified Embleya]|uniref:indole-3-glycerol phosphate synthase n=1 Tax=unclassified Embleya TaxID=2699296 RepID=UPI0034049C9B
MFTSVLMVEQPLSALDVEFVTGLHDEAMSFVVLMNPRGAEDRLLRTIDDVVLGELEEAAHEGDEPEGRDSLRPAALALEHTLRLLREAGSEAVGQVVEGHPLDLLRSVVDQVGADEVIVLTAPHLVEEFFHRDWAARARHKVGVPVLKLYAHSDDENEDDGQG